MTISSAVPFVSVDQMARLVCAMGVENFILGLMDYIKSDYLRWAEFDKSPRFAAHSPGGVIELMPTNDQQNFGFKYVNGHPKNTKQGMQTVIAFGMFSDIDSGYPVLLSEMTLLTALRTAATSALVAKHLAPKNASTLALIGNGAQSEFQALAMKAAFGISTVRLYDIDAAATAKCAANLRDTGLEIITCTSAQAAVQGAQVVTTCTADKQCATILTDNMIGAGIHINAIGGDCPGKTEIHTDILHRSTIFVEYAEQTRIEGDIQQLAADHPVTEFWKVLSGELPGRTSAEQTTLFDGVGFAIEDFSSLRFVYDHLDQIENMTALDLLANPENPRDLFGLTQQAMR
ncbi:MAG: ornithine cyclodeaminase [Parvibaculales bacterium]